MDKVDLEKLRQHIEKLRSLSSGLRHARENRKAGHALAVQTEVPKAQEKLSAPGKVPVQKSNSRAVDREPFYSKLPQELRQADISPLGKVGFAILHGYCQNKRLASLPEVEITLKTICREAHQGETKMRAALKELKEAGWIDIDQQGYKKPNRYRLYPSSLKAREAKFQLEQTHQKVLHDENLRKRLTTIKKLAK